MIENIKPAESLTVADFRANPVWEFLNDDEIGETMARPVEELPVETLDNRIVGAQARLGNGLEVWGLFGNFDVKNPRATQHFLALSIDRDGKWFHLARYFEGFTAYSPEALARFLGLEVDDVFPITVDVRGDPAALTAIVLKEPQEKITREDSIIWRYGAGHRRADCRSCRLCCIRRRGSIAALLSA
jgi:hypothetical protein